MISVNKRSWAVTTPEGVVITRANADTDGGLMVTTPGASGRRWQMFNRIGDLPEALRQIAEEAQAFWASLRDPA